MVRNVGRAVVFQQEFARPSTLGRGRSQRGTPVLDLVEAIVRDPIQGVGKPQPLRYVLEGCWSRRITQEHRLAYRVTDDRIEFLQARYHY